MTNLDATYRAALDACKALTIAMLDETRHENAEVLQKIEQLIGEGQALRLDIDPGTGRVALCIFDGAVSLQLGVMEPAVEVWAPPARH